MKPTTTDALLTCQDKTLQRRYWRRVTNRILRQVDLTDEDVDQIPRHDRWKLYNAV